MTRKAASGHAFVRSLAVSRVGEQGLVQTVTANADERTRLAGFLGVLEVKSLTAEIVLARWKVKGVRVEGTLKAVLLQSCVVTLEPVQTSVEASFERHFQPVSRMPGDRDHDAQDVFVSPDEEDPPEPLGHDIDLGEILVEELALNLDPYPRKEGVAFEPPAAPPRDNPFAALARLKPKP